MSERRDGRAADQPRPLSFLRHYTCWPAGSVLVSFGRTKVLCTASVAEWTPSFLLGSGRGWVTAEYSLLPGATRKRAEREAARGRQNGRTQEIQRLIGRSLRGVTDLRVLDGYTITLDCDVLQADGGTRCAAISGAWLALNDALRSLRADGAIKEDPLRGPLCAVSVGLVGGRVLLDLDYEEDSGCEVDMNVVMSGDSYVEIQGTGEGRPFRPDELSLMLDYARRGARLVERAQREALARD